MLLKILQISQEKLESFFNKVGVLRICDFMKVDSDTGGFLWNWQKFKNNYFEEHLWMSASKLYLKRDTGPFLKISFFFRCFSHIFAVHLFFYNQLGSGFSPQSCLYFRGSLISKLLNGCLVVWQNNLCLQGIQ